MNSPMNLTRAIQLAKASHFKSHSLLSQISKASQSDLCTRLTKSIENHIELIGEKLEELREKELLAEDEELTGYVESRSRCIYGVGAEYQYGNIQR